MSSSPPRTDRGSYLSLLALLLVVVIGFVALAVDVSTLFLADAELETGLDAAALAGASHLDFTADGVIEGRTSAIEVAHRNVVRAEPLELDGSHLTFGIWDYDASTFSPSVDVSKIDALRIERTLDDIPTPFAGAAFSSYLASVEGHVVAVRPPPEPVSQTTCFLPMAISSCVASQVEGSDPSVHSFRFGPDSQDDIAWAFPGGVSAAAVRDAFADTMTGQCVANTTSVGIGDPVALQNGIVASNLNALRQMLLASNDLWDVDLWGPKPPADPDSVFAPGIYPNLGIIQGPIVVVDDGGNCGMRYTQSAPVDHIVWAVIFDEYVSGVKKGFQVFVDMEHDWIDPGGSGGGGGSGNVKYWPAARLVE
jgi:hypothetical protein